MADTLTAQMIAFLPRLQRFAFALTGNWTEAEELVNNTSEQFLLRLKNLDENTKIEVLIFQIVQDLWKVRNKGKRVRCDFSRVETADDLANLDSTQALEDQLTLYSVTNAIALLPDEQKILIALVCIDGRSYLDASEITGIPKDNVVDQLSRARKTLYSTLF